MIDKGLGLPNMRLEESMTMCGAVMSPHVGRSLVHCYVPGRDTNVRIVAGGSPIGAHGTLPSA